jgi:molybdopterin synthase catalytic subunit
MNPEKTAWAAALAKGPLEAPATDTTTSGAVIFFHGVVRDTEAGLPIAAIDYSAYEGMAQPLLEQIARTASSRQGVEFVGIHHRLGKVPAGEASLLIHVSARHSAEALETCAFCLAEVKAKVPVWKRFIPA